MEELRRPGRSVNVQALLEIEKYPTVWQMTSTVSAKIDAPVAKIFEALFPYASVTGAPKVSSMEIIHSLEQQPRGIYTGAIGFLSPGRTAQFSVAIRTALIDMTTGAGVYGVGGGIVWDSDPADEYDECLAKARVLNHFEFDRSSIETGLSEFAATLERDSRRIRLLMSSDGRLQIEASVLVTNRGGDVLLWNEDGYITETSIANVVVRIEDQLFTPPVECGLLPGTYRESLLAQGEITERKIHIGDLSRSQDLILVNSVRGQYAGKLSIGGGERISRVRPTPDAFRGMDY